MKKTAEVVVIGGGCHGASIAYHLARRGMKDVVLVEKNFLGSGSTSKSSAMIREHYAFPELVKMARRSLEVFANFKEMVGGDAGFVQAGELILVPGNKRSQLQANMALQQALGVRCHLLPPEEVREIQPQLTLDREVLAAYHPDSGYANPGATTAAFAQRAMELGASVYEETEVTAINGKGGRVSAVVTSRGELSTPIVVNAAGPWGGRIAAMVGVDLPITPTRIQMTLFLHPWDLYQNYIMYADFTSERVYSRPEVKELVQVSVNHFTTEKADPDHYADSASEPIIARSLEWLKCRFSAMKHTSFRGGYAGVNDSTPDEYPLLGPVKEVEGFYCDVGWSGQGFKHCTAMGELMAELITTGKTTLVGLSPFRPSRFREGQPLTYTTGYDSINPLELARG